MLCKLINSYFWILRVTNFIFQSHTFSSQIIFFLKMDNHAHLARTTWDCPSCSMHIDNAEHECFACKQQRDVQYWTTTRKPFVPTIRLRHFPVEPEELDDTLFCPICCEQIHNNQRIGNLPCRHIFCSFCIQEWLNKLHKDCPMCRAIYPVKWVNFVELEINE